METATLREKLHSLIETSSKDKLEEIYDSLQDNDYSENFKVMLDAEFEQYQKDGEAIPYEEVNKLIEQLLHSQK